MVKKDDSGNKINRKNVFNVVNPIIFSKKKKKNSNYFPGQYMMVYHLTCFL